MKYWALLFAKLSAAGLVLWMFWPAAASLLPEPEPFLNVRHEPFARDLTYTMVAILYGLFSLGLLYLVALDHRYRCRTCLRRLRMPVAAGSWGWMLQLGRPRTEYICPYGHGTLTVPEFRFAGFEPADWKAHHDMWKELEELEETRK
jgi:hypothetical protein